MPIGTHAGSRILKDLVGFRASPQLVIVTTIIALNVVMIWWTLSGG